LYLDKYKAKALALAGWSFIPSKALVALSKSKNFKVLNNKSE
jgi:hypothetical protein